MPPLSLKDLSRRERQIVDVLLQQGEATAKDVQAGMPDAPGYSAVRALLARMLDKDLITHRQEAGKYIYAVKATKEEAQESALQRMLKTFFEGSAAKAVSALLGSQGHDLSAEELAVLEAQIKKAKQDKAK